MKALQIVSKTPLLIVTLRILFAVVPAAAISSQDLDSLNLDSLYYYPTNSCTSSNSLAPGATALSSGSSVYILGDSITERSAVTYQSSFQHHGITANIDASVSRSLNGPGIDGNKLSGMQAIAADTAEIKKAGAIVVGLGTNGGDTTQSIDQAVKALRANNATAPIYWIDTISVGRTDGYNQSVIGPGNRAIYSQSTTDKYQIIPWFKAVDPSGNPQNPSGAEIDPNNYIDNSDGLGVHPDAAGITALVNLVVAAVTSGTTTSSLGGNCCGSTVLVGTTNIAQIDNYFLGHKLSQIGISGILGNLDAESGIQPERLQGTPSGVAIPASSLTPDQLTNGTLGWGLAQWTPPGKIITPSKNSSKDPDLLAVQLDFLWSQIQGQVVSGLQASSSPQAAAFLFEKEYERPASLADASTRGALAETFYQYMTNGSALPPNVQPSNNSSSASQTNCSSNTEASSPTGYQNPLRDVQGLSPERIDQGVDYAGNGPVYAIGDGTVVSVTTTDSGWPGLGTSLSGAFIKYQLSDGPAKGDYVYFAEDCTPNVTAGQPVTSNTVICHMFEGGTNIETGWTTGAAGTAALASPQYQANGGGNFATSAGQNFSALLKSLGAPPGAIDGSAGSPTLMGYPNWQ